MFSWGWSSVFEKPKWLWCNNIVNRTTFNVRTLNTVNQLPDLTTSAAKQNMDIICILEHGYYQSKLEIKYYSTGKGWIFASAFPLENFVNDVIGVVGLLLSSCALKSLNSIERIQLGIMCASFNGNSMHNNHLLLESYQSQWWNGNHHLLPWVIFLSWTHSQIQHSNHRWWHECSNRQRWK